MTTETLVFYVLGYVACGLVTFKLHCWALKKIVRDVWAAYPEVPEEFLQSRLRLTRVDKFVGIVLSSTGPLALISLSVVLIQRHFTHGPNPPVSS